MNHNPFVKKILLSLLLVSSLAACQTTEIVTDTSNNTLYSTLWMQTAAEYEALSNQAYNTAQELLPAAKQDSTWTAALQQDGAYNALPPAIILDLDETAIDNSFYEARAILDQTGFTEESWNNWVREMQAEAITGAVEFTNKASEMDISIFYISNRHADVQDYTEQNLRELGFPVADSAVLSNAGKPEWTSAKMERRKWVADRHRILMLVGDDLNDFVPARNISIEQRKDLAEQHADKWGVKWFILPNPNYGSWKRALYTGREESDEERQQTRLNRLNDKRD